MFLNFNFSPLLTLLVQLVDRVFDESLNFRKIPPVISTNKAPEINGKPVELRPRAPDSLEPRALRRRTWNREDVRSYIESMTSKTYQHVDYHPLGCHSSFVTLVFFCLFRRCWTACCSIQFLSSPQRSDTPLTKQQERSGIYLTLFLSECVTVSLCTYIYISKAIVTECVLLHVISLQDIV